MNKPGPFTTGGIVETPYTTRALPGFEYEIKVRLKDRGTEFIERLSFSGRVGNDSIYSLRRLDNVFKLGNYYFPYTSIRDIHIKEIKGEECLKEN